MFRKHFVSTGFGLFVVLVILIWRSCSYLEIEKCQNGGGRWNREIRACESPADGKK
jgi:hypothetical protein